MRQLLPWLALPLQLLFSWPRFDAAPGAPPACLQRANELGASEDGEVELDLT